MKLYMLIHSNEEAFEDFRMTVLYVTNSLEKAKSICDKYNYKRDEESFLMDFIREGEEVKIAGRIIIKEIDTDTLLFDEKLLTEDCYPFRKDATDLF